MQTRTSLPSPQRSSHRCPSDHDAGPDNDDGPNDNGARSADNDGAACNNPDDSGPSTGPDNRCGGVAGNMPTTGPDDSTVLFVVATILLLLGAGAVWIGRRRPADA